MGDVGVCHYVVLVPDSSLLSLSAGPVYCGKLPYRIAAAYSYPSPLTLVFEILGFRTNHGTVEDTTLRAYLRPTFNKAIAADPRIIFDYCLRSDYCIRAY